MLLIFSPPPLSSPVNGEEALEENFSDSSLPLRERIKVRGERIFINLFFSPFSPLAGEKKSEGCS
jgi:hypothetical protein